MFNPARTVLTPLKMRLERKGEMAETTATAEKTFPTSSVSTVLVKIDLRQKVAGFKWVTVRSLFA